MTNRPLELVNEIMRGFAPAMPIAPIPNAPADDDAKDSTTPAMPVNQTDED